MDKLIKKIRLEAEILMEENTDQLGICEISGHDFEIFLEDVIKEINKNARFDNRK